MRHGHRTPASVAASIIAFRSARAGGSTRSASPKGQKKTAWLVDYKDQHGKRRARQFSTKKEAEAYADRARDEIRQGRHTHDRDSITIAVATDLWIAAAEAENLERSTIKRYRELSRLHIVPKFGALKLSQLTKAQVIEWRQELLTAKSRSMASKIVRALSAILNNAMEIGAISQNVASDVKVGRAKRECAASDNRCAMPSGWQRYRLPAARRA